jgi:hypothetical protein
MKTAKPKRIDATPRKRVFYSIIPEYNLILGLCELVDNAIDAARAKQPSVRVNLDLDDRQQSITVTDNGGGIRGDDFHAVVSPGASLNDQDGASIGYFGVGTKRAVIALAYHTVIASRAPRETANQVRIDEAWLQHDDWHLDLVPAQGIPAGTTRIELSRLRVEITEALVKRLRAHFGLVYSPFLADGRLELKLNGESVNPVELPKWAYPPDYRPRLVTDTLSIKEPAGQVEIEILAGLTLVSSPTGEYGVYLYCNERLIAQAVTSAEVGFISGIAGQPHPSISRTRVVVRLRGPARLMPWNSSKSEINYNSPVFRAIRSAIHQNVKHWAQLSRALPESQIAPYAKGEIVSVSGADLDTVARTYLPSIPMRRRVQYAEQLVNLNARLCEQKPWATGLNDALVAIDAVGRERRIEHPERIQLILLDSTLEIALKEYLVNESGQPPSRERLKQLANNRPELQKEVNGRLPFPANELPRIEYYRGLRNALIHERSSAGIKPDDVNRYQRIVEGFLKRAFGFRFPRRTEEG